VVLNPEHRPPKLTAAAVPAQKGEFFGEKIDLIATKQTRQNEFTAYLTVIRLQCKVRGVRL
jgi:hypothetical protein